MKITAMRLLVFASVFSTIRIQANAVSLADGCELQESGSAIAAQGRRMLLVR